MYLVLVFRGLDDRAGVNPDGVDTVIWSEIPSLLHQHFHMMLSATGQETNLSVIYISFPNYTKISIYSYSIYKIQLLNLYVEKLRPKEMMGVIKVI